MSLSAQLAIPIDEPNQFLREFVQRFPDEHANEVDAASEVVISVYGSSARIRFVDRHVTISLAGKDAAQHGIAKGMVAFHVQGVLGEKCPELVWTGDGAGVHDLPHFRELRVVSVQDISRFMRRVRLRGRDLARYAENGLHVRLLFPPEGREPVWPYSGPAALPVWPEGEDALTTRVYTLRRVDPENGTVDVDVVLHNPPGAGCRWARSVAAGDRVGMLGPGGGQVEQAEWTLMLGDETALPAIARSLEAMAHDAKGVAFVEVSDAGEEQVFAKPDGVELYWLHRNGAAPGTTSLLIDAARAVAWPETKDVFVWAGAEFEAFKEIRRFCRKERALKQKQHLVVAYWRRGQRQETTASRDQDDD